MLTDAVIDALAPVVSVAIYFFGTAVIVCGGALVGFFLTDEDDCDGVYTTRGDGAANRVVDDHECPRCDCCLRDPEAVRWEIARFSSRENETDYGRRD